MHNNNFVFAGTWDNGSGRRHHPYQQQHRQRHFYDEQQLALLDAEFQYDPFPNRENRRRIAQRLQVPDKSVMWWFQNRRRRVRQQKPNLTNRHSPQEIQYASNNDQQFKSNSSSFIPEQQQFQQQLPAPGFPVIQQSSPPFQHQEYSVCTEDPGFQQQTSQGGWNNCQYTNVVPQQQQQNYDYNYYQHQSSPEDFSPDSTTTPTSSFSNYTDYHNSFYNVPYSQSDNNVYPNQHYFNYQSQTYY